jgi:hypothetical protein
MMYQLTGPNGQYIRHFIDVPEHLNTELEHCIELRKVYHQAMELYWDDLIIQKEMFHCLDLCITIEMELVDKFPSFQKKNLVYNHPWVIMKNLEIFFNFSQEFK